MNTFPRLRRWALLNLFHFSFDYRNFFFAARDYRYCFSHGAITFRYCAYAPKLLNPFHFGVFIFITSLLRVAVEGN